MYKIIKNILSSYECEFIFSEFEKVEKEKDHQVKESDILFSWEISDKFCEKFKPLVEDFYSTKLNTVLGYTRKSFKGQTLTKHKDVTELVMCVSIKQSDINVNPLYIYIDGEKIEGKYENGILTVILPKKANDKQTSVREINLN